MTRAFSILALAGLIGCARVDTPPDIAVADAWARATVPGQTSAAAYATIINKGGEDQLVSVASPGSSAALHSSENRNGVASMRPIDALPIPAQTTVRLEPGKNHIMLTGISQPLRAGGGFELRLTFKRSGDRTVTGRVLEPSAGGPHGGH